nr:hypothetical protein [Tanacetum cinerariifolium]
MTRESDYIPSKPDLTFIDEQVESDSVDVVSNVISSDVMTVELKHESVDVKNKSVYNTIETKHVRKNNFSPLIIEDWNSDDESEETNSISLIMKIMMVDLFPLEMLKEEFLGKRHLKLEEFDGISTLLNTKMFKQLALMG